MKPCFAILGIAGFLALAGMPTPAQDDQSNKPVVHVDVNLVLLNVAVTDGQGHYVTGLRPSDFAVYEDKIPQKLATFGEGDAPQQPVDALDDKLVGTTPTETHSESVSVLAGANVFILFDTSNYMYRNFAVAQDAIAEFARSLDSPERLAFYSYSRDLYKAAKLTNDRTQILRGVRSTVAGDNPALYNALLLTLKDAGTYSGRKVVVVFSNGPDTASMVAPEDISELAQSEGIPIYVISTNEAKQDPISATVFQRMTQATGGEVYFAKNWKRQQQAFASIRDDIGHLYSLSYYPKNNANRGWRAIAVKLTGPAAKKYHVRTRSGYRPRLARVITPAP